MLTTNRELLQPAMRQGYAIGAFNVQNLESLLAVVDAAIEEKSPVIVAITPSTLRYGSLALFAEMGKTAGELTSIPMSLHLDHGDSFKTASDCIDSGFTSVMIDGSALRFEENVTLAKRIVDIAHPRGVSVEAELGRIAGIEEYTVEEKQAILTDPNAAAEFVDRTGVDALAVAIGTSHGACKFKAEPVLDFERLRLIRKKVSVPLVLHGASSVPQWLTEKAVKYGAKLPGAKGIPEEHIQKAISEGISKINIDTDLRLAFTSAMRQVLVESPAEFDPRKILGPARSLMKQVVAEKMRLFGSSGKAT